MAENTTDITLVIKARDEAASTMQKVAREYSAAVEQANKLSLGQAGGALADSDIAKTINAQIAQRVSLLNTAKNLAETEILQSSAAAAEAASKIAGEAERAASARLEAYRLEAQAAAVRKEALAAIAEEDAYQKQIVADKEREAAIDAMLNQELKEGVRLRQEEVEASSKGGSEKGGGFSADKAIKGIAGGFNFFILNRVGSMLNQFGQQLEKVNEQIDEGNASFGEIAAGIARGVPILGEFVQGWDHILSAMTGASEQIKQEAIQTDAANKYVEAKLDMLREEKELRADLAKQVADSQHAQATAGLNGPAKQYADAAFKLKTLAADSDAAMQKSIDGIKEKFDSKIKPLREDQDKIAPSTGMLDRLNASIGSHAPGFINKIGSAAWMGADSSNPFTAQARVDSDEAQAAHSREAIDKQIHDLEVQKAADIAAVQKAAADKLKADTAGLDAELLAAKKEAGADAIKEAQRVEQEIARTRAEGQAAQLRAAGQNYQADLVLLKQSEAEKNVAIQQWQQERYATITQNYKSGMITKGQAQSQSVAVSNQTNEAYGANADDASQKAAQAKVADQERQAQITQSIHSATMDNLREQVGAGDVLHAQELARLEIQDKYNAKLVELRKLLDQTTGAQHQQVQALIDGLPAQEKGAEAAERKKTLEEESTKALQLYAQSGNKQAERDLQKLQIQKQYMADAARLQSIIGDKSASADEKANARTALAGLGNAQKLALSRVGRVDFAALAGTQNVEAGGSAGGVSSAARENALFFRSAGADPAKDTAKNTGETNALIRTLNSLIESLIKKPGVTVASAGLSH